ncbi:hypothetical protein SKAU_G00047820 [Synaphobranchus kaupii]|uniref:Uncharacterized protein n=1 Tax=Synaphobranchus kaupii TaxID=118154 RepID=A0A9Q1G3D2_SYNKA|nr:hypothetical protein SKAU_G00047820 [Synaphobranchus kaupii]
MQGLTLLKSDRNASAPWTAPSGGQCLELNNNEQFSPMTCFNLEFNLQSAFLERSCCHIKGRSWGELSAPVHTGRELGRENVGRSGGEKLTPGIDPPAPVGPFPRVCRPCRQSLYLAGGSDRIIRRNPAIQSKESGASTEVGTGRRAVSCGCGSTLISSPNVAVLMGSRISKKHVGVKCPPRFNYASRIVMASPPGMNYGSRVK